MVKKRLTPKEWQEKIEKDEPVKRNRKITLKLKYRDEKCRHCGKTFRAGEACEGYLDWHVVGYSGIGISDNRKRHGYFCNMCMEKFIYRFMGEPSLLDHDRAPSKFYNFKSFEQKHPRVEGMTIKGKMVKWNKDRFMRETRRFSKWVKKNEPWNIVDYYKFGGAR